MVGTRDLEGEDGKMGGGRSKGKAFSSKMNKLQNLICSTVTVAKNTVSYT